MYIVKPFIKIIKMWTLACIKDVAKCYNFLLDSYTTLNFACISN